MSFVRIQLSRAQIIAGRERAFKRSASVGHSEGGKQYKGRGMTSVERHTLGMWPEEGFSEYSGYDVDEHMGPGGGVDFPDGSEIKRNGYPPIRWRRLIVPFHEMERASRAARIVLAYVDVKGEWEIYVDLMGWIEPTAFELLASYDFPGKAPVDFPRNLPHHENCKWVQDSQRPARSLPWQVMHPVPDTYPETWRSTRWKTLNDGGPPSQAR